MTADLFSPVEGSDAWLIDQLRTRPRRLGWHTIMTAAADRLEQLTQPQQGDTP